MDEYFYCIGEEKNDEQIPIEMLSAETLPSSSTLVEIKDHKLLAHINQLVPGLLQTGNAASNAVQAAQINGQVLYQAILPAGEQLSRSKGIDGAFRGFYQNSNGGIKGQADFLPVQNQTGSAVAANTFAAAMGIAAMVVGQYYMTTINDKLGKISDTISKIANFQDNEYRSRVLALVEEVMTISEFQIEILENSEMRFVKINQLESLEYDCAKLLGQANLSLTQTKKVSNYKDYEKEINEAQKWYLYQRPLLEIMGRISDLKYTLHFGAVSREQCISLLQKYTERTITANRVLKNWHQTTAQNLGIDTSKMRRKKEGMDRLVHFLPGVFNDDFKFCAIPRKTTCIIDAQIAGHVCPSYSDTTELYAKDVRLIAKEGKVFYLLEDNRER